MDDEDEVRGMLSEFLTQRGYSIYTARDGIEAMQLLDREPGIAVDWTRRHI
jgi:CheY-like chemotaxis protein